MSRVPLVLRCGLAMVALAVVLLQAVPVAWAVEPDGARLFEANCAGCHLHGGNIIRRGKTLKLSALERQDLASQQAIASIAAAGIGQMSGYQSALGDAGVDAVAAWVWQQAQAGWPKG